MKNILFLGSMFALLALGSCKKDGPKAGDELIGHGTFEYNGRTYVYLYYDDQVWMIENLAYLPAVSPPSVGSDVSPLYYVYDYEGTSVVAAKATENYKTYGVLYNWQAAKTACPPGWHLPTDEEWKTLEDWFGMSDAEQNQTSYRESGSVGYQMKSTDGWMINPGSTPSNGSNAYHFTGLPGGYRANEWSGVFDGLNQYGSFWTSTENGTLGVWTRQLYWWGYGVYRECWDRKTGFSIRCVMDN